MKNYLLLLTTFFSFLASAQISGTVKDPSGSPIENALVCHADNPSVYTKTNNNGEYTLTQGNSSTRLRVAALKFETIKSTSTRQIVLSEDPLLNTDVYHISFDHLKNDPNYNKDDIRDDFPIAYSKGVDEGAADTDRMEVDYTESVDPDGVSIKVRFPQGKLKTNDSGVDMRIPLMNTFKDNFYESNDLYLSYWIKFSDNFDFSLCGGKLPSLGGTTLNTPDMPREDRNQDAWKGRIMWRKGGSIQFYMELPDSSFTPTNDERFWGEKVVDNGNSICEFEYTNYLSEPGWHNIELHYKFETPGQNDGIFEGWVDGQNYDFMEAEVFNNYRPAGTSRENITINRILISAFLGGSDTNYEPSEDIYAWFDEFRVSTTRIDEYDKYTNTLTVSENEGEVVNPAYPNPSTGIFTLAKSTNWIVYDILGNSIEKGKGKQVNLAGKASGMYFLKTDEATQLSKLILK